MRRFVLAVDLDGVCADYQAALAAHLTATGRAPGAELTSWSFVDAGWFRDEGEYLAVHRDAIGAGMFATMAEIDGASDALWELSDVHDVHIRVVTHRLIANGDHHLVVGDTLRWLNTPRADGRPRVPFRDLCFLGSKSDAGADCHLDDAPHQLQALTAAGQQVVIFDQPYNRTLAGRRARNWAEVVDHVAELAAAGSTAG